MFAPMDFDDFAEAIRNHTRSVNGLSRSMDELLHYFDEANKRMAEINAATQAFMQSLKARTRTAVR